MKELSGQLLAFHAEYPGFLIPGAIKYLHWFFFFFYIFLLGILPSGALELTQHLNGKHYVSSRPSDKGHTAVIVEPLFHFYVNNNNNGVTHFFIIY